MYRLVAASLEELDDGAHLRRHRALCEVTALVEVTLDFRKREPVDPLLFRSAELERHLLDRRRDQQQIGVDLECQQGDARSLSMTAATP